MDAPDLRVDGLRGPPGAEIVRGRAARAVSGARARAGARALPCAVVVARAKARAAKGTVLRVDGKGGVT